MSFNQNIAVIIGINDYQSVRKLESAVSDATELSKILREQHGYEDIRLLIDDISLARLRRLINEDLKEWVKEDSRLLFYFAGHGVASDSDRGPEGYLVPQDATLENTKSCLGMKELHDALIALPCRHMLAILDCCFAGAFRWSTLRNMLAFPEIIHKERYDRYVNYPAWQVITSASYNQEALDVFGVRGEDNNHSPFARALFDGLQGKADRIFEDPNTREKKTDGVITATELYLYLDDVVGSLTYESNNYQKPGLFPLKKHDRGEFIFLVPGHKLNLPAAPALNTENNPYRGLEAYTEQHSGLFFGRNKIIDDLTEKVKNGVLTIVLGASGIGKSSLVNAGLVPNLRTLGWQFPEQIQEEGPGFRPRAKPIYALARHLQRIDSSAPDAQELERNPNALSAWLGTWHRQNPGKTLLLFIDQFEELITMCRDSWERERFLEQLAHALDVAPGYLRVVITVRSDFEPQFSSSPYLKTHWQLRPRFVVPPMTQDELRQVIEEPASSKVLYFEPDSLVEILINEVVNMPRALPLLSFALSEMYLHYVKRQSDNRALTNEDYVGVGGVVGALQKRANDEYNALDEPSKATMQRMMLRMVSLEGGGLARRQTLVDEFIYSSREENSRIESVKSKLIDARLIVSDTNAEGKSCIEPAHDALINSWAELRNWINKEKDNQELLRRITDAVDDWLKQSENKQLLWHNSPFLPVAKNILNAKLNNDKSGIWQLPLSFFKWLFPSAHFIKPATWLNKKEEEFISESIIRKGTNNRWLTFGITAAFFGIFIVAIIASMGWNRAALEGSRQLSLRLANEAQNIPAGEIDTALLLAAESNEIKATPQSSAAIAELLALNGHLFSYIHCKGDDRAMNVALASEVLTLFCMSDVSLWDVQSGKEVARIALHEPRPSLLLATQKLALAGGDPSLRIIDFDKGLKSLVAHDAPITAFVVNLEETELFSGDENGEIRRWDISSSSYSDWSSEIVGVLPGGISDLYTDGRVIEGISWSGESRVWLLDTLEETTQTPQENLDPNEAFRFSPPCEGQEPVFRYAGPWVINEALDLIAYVNERNEIVVSLHSDCFTLAGNTHNVSALTATMSDAGLLLASAGQIGKERFGAIVWNLNQLNPSVTKISSPQTGGRWTGIVKISADGKFIAQSFLGENVTVFTLTGPQPNMVIEQFNIPIADARDIAFSHDSIKMAIIDSGGNLHVVNNLYLNKDNLKSIPLNDSFTRVAFDREERLALVSEKRQLFSFSNNSLLSLASLNLGYSNCEQFSEDGQYFIVERENGLDLIRTNDGRIIEIEFPDELTTADYPQCTGISLSRSGSLVRSVSTYLSRPLQIFDIHTQKFLRAIENPFRSQSGLSTILEHPHVFAEENKVIVSSVGDEPGFIVWDLSSSTVAGRLPLQNILDFDVASGMERVVILGNHGTYIWDVDVDQWEQIARGLANRELQPVERQNFGIPLTNESDSSETPIN
jgi:Caspase domain